jgi:hypothetical protein
MPDSPAAPFEEYPATLADRVTQLAAARETLLAELDAAEARRASGKWSVAEVAYHLHLVERGIGRMMQKFLAPEAAAARHERKGDGELRAEWQRVSRLASPDYFPVEAPAPVAPANAPGFGESVELLRQSRRALLDAISTATLDDLASFSRPHLVEAMGMLTGAGWLSLVAYHELRHVEQLRRLQGLEIETGKTGRE